MSNLVAGPVSRVHIDLQPVVCALKIWWQAGKGVFGARPDRIQAVSLAVFERQSSPAKNGTPRLLPLLRHRQLAASAGNGCVLSDNGDFTSALVSLKGYFEGILPKSPHAENAVNEPRVRSQ